MRVLLLALKQPGSDAIQRAAAQLLRRRAERARALVRVFTVRAHVRVRPVGVRVHAVPMRARVLQHVAIDARIDRPASSSPSERPRHKLFRAFIRVSRRRRRAVRRDARAVRRAPIASRVRRGRDRARALARVERARHARDAALSDVARARQNSTPSPRARADARARDAVGVVRVEEALSRADARDEARGGTERASRVLAVQGPTRAR